MRQISSKILIQQAKDFFRQTRYIPSNYDALFHTNHFSSPVTIRRHFGSWENYIDKSFDSMVLDYPYKMFYGGYNRHFKVTLPVSIKTEITYNGNVYDCLGTLTNKNISQSEAWVITTKWEGLIEILENMGIEFILVPAERRFLTPFVLIGNEYALASFDTPHMENHYKRITKVMKYLNQNYDTLNLNGVKKNHVKSAVERLLE